MNYSGAITVWGALQNLNAKPRALLVLFIIPTSSAQTPRVPTNSHPHNVNEIFGSGAGWHSPTLRVRNRANCDKRRMNESVAAIGREYESDARIGKRILRDYWSGIRIVDAPCCNRSGAVPPDDSRHLGPLSILPRHPTGVGGVPPPFIHKSSATPLKPSKGATVLVRLRGKFSFFVAGFVGLGHISAWYKVARGC